MNDMVLITIRSGGGVFRVCHPRGWCFDLFMKILLDAACSVRRPICECAEGRFVAYRELTRVLQYLVHRNHDHVCDIEMVVNDPRLNDAMHYHIFLREGIWPGLIFDS
jgi:hypothetical protein